MALQDRVQEETNEVKNALEAYVYQLRGKLADAYAEYSTEQERANASHQLEKMEVRLVMRLCTSPAYTSADWRCATRAWHDGGNQ